LTMRALAGIERVMAIMEAKAKEATGAWRWTHTQLPTTSSNQHPAQLSLPVATKRTCW
jgi:hypothetical protein